MIGHIVIGQFDIIKQSGKSVPMIRIKQLLLLGAGMVISASCAAQSPHDLTAEEFHNRIANDSTAVVVDVRTPEEYAAGHLPGAINLDYNNQASFVNGCENLTPNCNYYVYCRSGRRSDAACNQMMDYGLPVYNMCGGIQSWTQAGYPVVK